MKKSHFWKSKLCQRHRDSAGSITLFTLMMTMTLLGVFGALVTYGMNQMRHAETLRTLELTGQSILHTYDRRLLESYSLLAVDLGVVAPSDYMNTETPLGFWRKGQSRSWTFEPRQTLDDPAAFLLAVERSVAAGVMAETLAGFTSWMEASPQINAKDEGKGSTETKRMLEQPLSEDSASPASQADKDLAAKGIRWIREMGQPDGQREGNADKPVEEATPELGSAQKAILPSRLYAGLKKPLLARERLAFVYYASRHFRNRVTDGRAPFYKHAPADTFFKSEQEYLLYGHGAEAINEARAFADVFLLRLAGNTAHVVGCQEKQQWISAVSGAIHAVFGVPAVITSPALVLTWATAETKSDLRRLLAGEALPWIHGTEEQWRTRFGSEVGAAPAGVGDGRGTETEAGTKVGAEAPGHIGYADYGDHLSALLWMRTGTVNVLRAMDLIMLGSGEDGESGKGDVVDEGDGGSGNSLRGIDLSQRAMGFSIKVEASGRLPAVTWEDGYGWD